MKKVLILGATSAIAQSTAKVFGERGDALFLVGRNPAKLESVVSDLKVRGCRQVGSMAVDLNQLDRHEEIISEARKFLGELDTVLIAHGELGVQEESQQDFQKTLSVLKTNYISPISLLTHLANDFEKQKYGTLAVISSVAGDRGRQSNYVYGSTKGGLSVFLAGLRNRLYRSSVQVVTIKPGFVDTPMTRNYKKGPLWATPDSVGRSIVRAMDRGKSDVYLPWFWFWIMLIVRSIPEWVFKRLKL